MTRVPRLAAHDLNNLLTGIMGIADTARDRPGIDPETHANLCDILIAARRAAALARILTGETEDSVPGPLWLNETIRAAARLLERPGVMLELALSEPDDRVVLPPGELERVLENLATNAHRAMGDGGTLTVLTRPVRLTAAESGFPDTIPPGVWQRIQVADTGDGIPRAALPRIFDTGFTTWAGQGGSGLGLASVREIVRAAGGFLTVDSVPFMGTTVSVYLPGGV